MQEQQGVAGPLGKEGNGSEPPHSGGSTTPTEMVHPRPISSAMALVSISLLVVTAFMAYGGRHWEAWALAGAALFGGAVILRLLWDTAATDSEPGERRRPRAGLMDSRLVSKSMVLVGTVLFMVAAYIRYVDTSNVAWGAILGWTSIILLVSAIILRFAWDS